MARGAGNALASVVAVALMSVAAVKQAKQGSRGVSRQHRRKRAGKPGSPVVEESMDSEAEVMLLRIFGDGLSNPKANRAQEQSDWEPELLLSELFGTEERMCSKATFYAQDEPMLMQTEAQALVSKLFGIGGAGAGGGKRMCIEVEAVAGEEAAAVSAAATAAADREAWTAVRRLLALLLAAFSSTCFMACAVVLGDLRLVVAAALVSRLIAAPAAVGVRRYWGRSLNEALDESIKATGVAWDLAVI